MLKKIQERIFPFIITLAALSVSATAAFYSVSGLSKLFAGAAFAVIVMAASLEVAKLVIASLLYQYRKSLPTFLKYYLSIACFVLILITSMGIYGFLSSAYQETSAKAGSIDSQISLIETRRDNTKEQLNVYIGEKESINKAVAALRSGLANNVIQYTNAEGVLITTTSSSTRKALEKQLDQAIDRQTIINNKLDGLNTKLFEYETEIVEVSINNDIAGELGPLKYLSGLTGMPMDQIINYLLLTIIFVFDPLAIALVIAANFAFAQLRPKTRENLYGEKVEIKEDNDWDSTLNDGLDDDEDGESILNVNSPGVTLPGEEEIEDSKESEIVELYNNGFPKGYASESSEEQKVREDKLLDTSSTSGWRKNKILNERAKENPEEDNDLTIKY
jgi:hypothetical protein|tara:strand:+ start:1513 stop:2682 length:1170 start_codon:yes stop_codon:yes gene_type:complete